ncbi:MAG: CPBP family intramembrane metalloprotease [Defluviitaleaceae bacterium]|nr:CPBP family intramembrane metalloprotease [Defluviitaleaceae bacterium]
MGKHTEGSKFMLVILVWFVGFQFVSVTPVAILGELGIWDMNLILQSPWFIIAMQLGGLILPLVVWSRIKKESLLAHLPRQKLSGISILIIVVLGFLLQPAMMTISGISSLFFPNLVSEMIYTFMEQPLWLILLASAVTPAVCEELVFRGYIQTKHGVFPIRKAALLNGLFFGIIHLNLQQFAYAFALGAIFAYMVHYTKSIWAGILPHFIINASQGILGRLVFLIEPTEVASPSTGLSAEAQAILVMGSITILLMPVIIILFRMLKKHSKRCDDAPTPITDTNTYNTFGEQSPPHDFPETTRHYTHDPYFKAIIIVFLILVTMFSIIPLISP